MYTDHVINNSYIHSIFTCNVPTIYNRVKVYSLCSPFSAENRLEYICTIGNSGIVPRFSCGACNGSAP